MLATKISEDSLLIARSLIIYTLHSVSSLHNTLVVSAMCAAIVLSTTLNPMADYPATTMRAQRRKLLYRTLKGIKIILTPLNNDLKAFIVLIVACSALAHYYSLLSHERRGLVDRCINTCSDPHLAS